MPNLIRAAEDAYPSTEVYRPVGDLAENYEAELYLPTAASELHKLEVSLFQGGRGLGIEGGHTPEDIAGFIAWFAHTAAIPNDGSVLLVDWANDVVPLTPDITTEEILAARR